jgi:hypothetical protein
MTKEQARDVMRDYLSGLLHQWNKKGGLTFKGVAVTDRHIARFVRSVKLMEAPEDTDRADYSVARDVFPFCGIFEGAADKGGYRRFYFGNTAVGAHRFRVLLEEGEFPEGKEVCHDCDRPGCVIHVALGGHTENMQTQAERGRQNYASTLSERRRRQVVRLYGDFPLKTIQKLLKREGVNISTRQIMRIGNGRCWPEEWQAVVASMTPTWVQFAKAMGSWNEETMETHRKRILQSRPVRLGTNAPNTKLTREQVIALRADFCSCDFSLMQLARKYSIYRQTVSDVVLGKTYSDVEGIVSSEHYSVVMKEARERRLLASPRYNDDEQSHHYGVNAGDGLPCPFTIRRVALS